MYRDEGEVGRGIKGRAVGFAIPAYARRRRVTGAAGLASRLRRRDQRVRGPKRSFAPRRDLSRAWRALREHSG